MKIMNKNLKSCLLVLVVLLISANSTKAQSYGAAIQEKKYREALRLGCEDFKRKNESTAIVLGILPGGGSFYTGEIGLGIADLLLWPISPIWDMPLAVKKAREINMTETILSCEESGRMSSVPPLR
jgi:hypothetical protein